MQRTIGPAALLLHVAVDRPVQENEINLCIWGAVGAVLGWLAGMMAGSQRAAMIENVLVGAFGAMIGGEAIATAFGTPVAGDSSFHFRSLAFAVAGAVVLLGLLKLMHRAVGPPTGRKNKRRGGR